MHPDPSTRAPVWPIAAMVTSDGATPGEPAIVLLDGTSKRVDQRFDRTTYRRVAELRDEHARLRRLAFTPPSAGPRR